MKTLVLNGGSSSFKCWFHDVAEPLPATAPQPLWQKMVPWHGEPLDQLLATVLEQFCGALTVSCVVPARSKRSVTASCMVAHTAPPRGYISAPQSKIRVLVIHAD